MSQVIPVGICKLSDTNEDEVEKSVQIIEKKKAKIQLQTNVLKTTVDALIHENVVLDKESHCTESLCEKIKTEVSEVKSKTEDAACCLESTKWRIYKTQLLKEFENRTNKDVCQQKFKYDQLDNHKTQTDQSNDVDAAPLVYCLQDTNIDKTSLEILREKAEKLKQDIERKKKGKETVDVNMLRDTQILERRNAALIVRYQRQVQEMESRYRQTMIELNSLKKLLTEKKTLLDRL